MRIKRFLLFSLVLFLIPVSSSYSADEAPVYSAEKTGEFFRDWLLCGPFPNSDDFNLTDYKHGERCKGFLTDLLKDAGGEAKIEPKVGDSISHPDLSTPRSWFLYQSKSDLVHLNDIMIPNDNVAAYAFCWIDSPDERRVMAAIGSNDNVKCWLDGELVHVFSIPDGRWLEADDDYVPITLKKGRNRLLLKVCEGTGDFGLAFRLLDYKETKQSILKSLHLHTKLTAVTKENALQITFGTPHRWRRLHPAPAFALILNAPAGADRNV